MTDTQVFGQFIVAINVSIYDVLLSYTQREVNLVGKISPSDPALSKTEIAAKINLKTKNGSGAFLISFPMVTFLKIMGMMHKENFTNLCPEIADWPGEFANIICNMSKEAIYSEDNDIEFDFPNVLHNTEIHDFRSKNSPLWTMHFYFENEQFFTEIFI